MNKSKKLIAEITKRGFYIILFLCICAIGISGYVMFYTPDSSPVVADWSEEVQNFPFPEDSTPDFEPVISHEELEVIEDVQAPVKEEKKTETNKAVATVKKEEPEELTFVKPVEGEVIVPFSGDELVKSKTMGDWRAHTGVDISAKAGDKVHAIADGTVEDVFEDEMMGYTVKIRHKQGCVSTYSNLMKGVVVKKGEKVKAGQVIGGVGDSAVAESLEEAHLHLELTENNVNRDPMKFIK